MYLSKKERSSEIRKLSILVNMTRDDNMVELCKHCGMDTSIRNPSGYCDHLHYPEACKICQDIISFGNVYERRNISSYFDLISYKKNKKGIVYTIIATKCHDRDEFRVMTMSKLIKEVKWLLYKLELQENIGK